MRAPHRTLELGCRSARSGCSPRRRTSRTSGRAAGAARRSGRSAGSSAAAGCRRSSPRSPASCWSRSASWSRGGGPASGLYNPSVEKPLRIGVLAVQGNFREHAAVLRRLGAEPVEVRLPAQLDGLDGLIPGRRVDGDHAADAPLRDRRGASLVRRAGLRHLRRDDHPRPRPSRPRRHPGRAQRLRAAGHELRGRPRHRPRRRARCAASSSARRGSRRPAPTSRCSPRSTGIRCSRGGRVLVAAFHPELTDDTRIHELFLNMVREETHVRA